VTTRTLTTLRQIAALTACMFTACLALAGSAAADVEPKAPLGGTVCGGNTIYIVCVSDISQVGRYTARTGPAHPVPNRNFLFAGEISSPGTSFNSYRSFTSGTTYTQGAMAGAVNLDTFAPTTTPIGTTGVRTTWNVTGADNLRIEQVVNVNGTTHADSNIEVTTTITNTGTSSRDLGIRYLWDYQIGQDDGPTFRERNPDGAVRIHEAEFRPVAFEYYEIADNDFNDPTSPLYAVLGTADGPTNVTPAPTDPTQITYGCWPTAFDTAFDYSIVPGRDVATFTSPCGPLRGGDNTTIYWWGRDASTARVLAPGASVTERALLFATLPGAPPPFGAGPAANLTLEPASATNQAGEEHCVTATVTDAAGAPVAGVAVQFTVSGANTANGTVTTGADGTATFCYTGTTAGEDMIAAVAQGGNNPRDTATKTYEPGAPFRVLLDPSTATNTVDDEHCVTATVADRFGNPISGVKVRFTVTGPGATSGSATTGSNGQTTFCYRSALPGLDAIHAYADTNDDGVQGDGEPEARAAKTWVIPASTEGCKVTYGGRITASNGDKSTFGGSAQVKGGTAKGQQEFQDHGPVQPRNVHSIDVQAVTCSGANATIFGEATIAGSGRYDYRIDLGDAGEPGTTDTYRIRLSDGYDSGEQTLEGGNVQTRP
jgi:hypothetical protein